jgi:hypothetical protein
LFACGTSGVASNVIDYITIASTGNATDFGDLQNFTLAHAACASSTRGLFAGGTTNLATYINVIQYVTIASTGDTTDFGDLINPARDLAACSNVHGGL